MLQSLNGMKGMHIYDKTKYSKCATSIARWLYVVCVSCLDLLIQQAALRGRSVRSGTLHTARLFMLFYTKLLRGSYVPDRVSLCVLRPALPCNLNFYINGLSINYWGYIVRQLPCVTNGCVDGKCFLLCVWQTAGGLLGAACWLYAQLLLSLWPRWELKPSVRPSLFVKIGCLL